jgi:hypothetical protein
MSNNSPNEDAPSTMPINELAPILKLYNTLTAPKAIDSSSTAKAKATARKVGEKVNAALEVSPPRNTEQYTEDDQNARATNELKNMTGLREQLKGDNRRREAEGGEKKK